MPPRLTEAERQRIIALYETGLSLRAIALDVKCSHNTVRYWCRVFREENRIGPLPPKSTPSQSEADPEFLLTVAKDHPELSEDSVKTTLNLKYGTDGVNHAPRDIRIIRETSSPYSDKDHRELMEFADDHGCWNFDQWSSVVFSDEHNFPLNVDLNDPLVKRPRMEYQGQRRPHQVSILVWGCMTTQSLGPLYRIDHAFDSETYKDVLRDVMVPFVRQGPFPDGDFLFQHKRSPVHNARVVRDLLHDRKIQEIVWPAKGANLSPMWAVWRMLEKAITLMEPPPTSREELWENVLHIWEQLRLDRDIARELVSEIPERLQQLVQDTNKTE